MADARVRAPELEGRGFVGGPPVALRDLRGRVVLLDFWTFACINCLHVLEEVRALEQRFGDDLVVIGVHSPKFPNEADAGQLRRAVERYDVPHRVLDDADRRTWEAFAVRAWPTLTLIDPEGYVALQVSGEGRGAQLGGAIDTLLATHRAKGTLVRGPLPQGEEPVLRPATGLRFPGKLAWDEVSATLAVADTGHHRVVLLDGEGTLLSVIGTGAAGDDDGPFDTASFHAPQGVCFWDGDLYVADTGNHRLRLVPAGSRYVETLATPELRSPWDVAPFGGVLVVAMAGAHQLWGWDPGTRRLGLVAGSGAEGLADGPAGEAQLAQPSGLAPLGGLLGFVDSESSSLRALAVDAGGRGTVTTAVGAGLFEWGDADGGGAVARLQHPLGLAAVPGTGWLVADTYNHRLRRYDVTSGVLDTVAGSRAGYADATGAEARFDEPSGVIVVDGAALVADTNNHAVRRVDLATGAVTTLQPAGLAPPGTAPLVLSPARLQADGETELVVGLRPPPHAALDRSSGAPVRVRVTATPPSLLRETVDWVGDELPARLTVPLAHAGEGTLRIDVRGAFCDVDDGPGAACRVEEAAYVAAVALGADGATTLVAAPAGAVGY